MFSLYGEGSWGWYRETSVESALIPFNCYHRPKIYPGQEWEWTSVSYYCHLCTGVYGRAGSQTVGHPKDLSTPPIHTQSTWPSPGARCPSRTPGTTGPSVDPDCRWVCFELPNYHCAVPRLELLSSGHLPGSSFFSVYYHVLCTVWQRTGIEVRTGRQFTVRRLVVRPTHSVWCPVSVFISSTVESTTGVWVSCPSRPTTDYGTRDRSKTSPLPLRTYLLYVPVVLVLRVVQWPGLPRLELLRDQQDLLLSTHRYNFCSSFPVSVLVPGPLHLLSLVCRFHTHELYTCQAHASVLYTVIASFRSPIPSVFLY